jgi:antitoxin ParD1/3/4
MPTRKTRNASLTPEPEARVDEHVAFGRDRRSAGEADRAALRLLESGRTRAEGAGRSRLDGAPWANR